MVKGKLQKSKSINIKKTDLSSIKFEGALNYTDVSEYKLGKMLGQGAYAIVREATHIQTGCKVAVKIYDKYKLK